MLELETRGSKTGKHSFEPLGTSSSSSWEPVVTKIVKHWFQRLGTASSYSRTGKPWFQDWEALIRTFGSQQFLELGGRGSKIGKHWFQRLGTASSYSRTGKPWFEDWEALIRTFGSQQFLELGGRGSKIGKHWFEPAVPRTGNPCANDF